jgi:hypothetical protein
LRLICNSANPVQTGPRTRLDNAVSGYNSFFEQSVTEFKSGRHFRGNRRMMMAGNSVAKARRLRRACLQVTMGMMKRDYSSFQTTRLTNSAGFDDNNQRFKDV